MLVRQTLDGKSIFGELYIDEIQENAVPVTTKKAKKLGMNYGTVLKQSHRLL